jgi:transcriptional regulator with XRE-family HTH domain
MSTKRNFSELRAQIDAKPPRRARVEEYKRGALAALALAELREARNLRQADVAISLGVSQANISRVEREQDVCLSTLGRYIRALGGALEVNAVFPDQKVRLGSFSSSYEPGQAIGIRSTRESAQAAKFPKTKAKAAKVPSKPLRDTKTGKVSKRKN